MSIEREEPCPWCHRLRAEFRCGDQGYGEEDIDAARACPDARRAGAYSCEERPLRVTAELRLDHEQRMVGFLCAALQARGDARTLGAIIEWARSSTTQEGGRP